MPEAESRLHEHKDFAKIGPVIGRKMCIIGRKLIAGDVVEEGDWYESSTGQWLPADDQFTGMALPEGAAVVVVRPNDA